MKFKMAATAGLSLTLDPMGKMFQNASSLKPLGQLKPNCPGMIIGRSSEALKSLYRSPGYKKNQLVLYKNYVLQWYSSWNYDQHKKHKVCKGPSND
jgi:hypothetical protein